MKTYYMFESSSDPALRGFTGTPAGEALPVEDGPWVLKHTIPPNEEWRHDISQKVVDVGILENGFYLWAPFNRPNAHHPVIESDRVEGTPVFGPDSERIGTIKRLLIEKVSGRVLYVDVTFGGFLGLGKHHHTVPWDKLNYDTKLGGYRTTITEAQVRGAPDFYGDTLVWPDRKREQELRDYWHDDVRGPI